VISARSGPRPRSAVENHVGDAGRTPRRCLAGVAAVVISLACASASHAAALTVYSSLPLDTPERAVYENIVRGEQLALEQSGGFAGEHAVRLVSLNDASEALGSWTPQRASANARRASADASTIAYLGEYNSGTTAVSLPILNEAGIFQLSPTNAAVGLTRAEAAAPGEPQKYYPTGVRTFGRVAPADHLQAAALAKMVDELSVRRVFLVDDSEVYGVEVRRLLRPRLRSRGIVAGGVGHLRRGRGIRAIARRIAASRAQAMVFTGITANGAPALWRAVHRRRPRLKLIGSDGVAEPLFTRHIGRGAAKRTWISQYVRPISAWPPAGQQFAAAFGQRYGRPPGDYAIFGYEAMRVTLDCIRNAGAADAGLRQRVVDAFRAIRDRDSVLGRYSIDEHGDTTLSTYGIWRISRSGRLVYDRTVDSSG
jgi:branched-chain amino acid transport system substrate-binding protein